MTDKFDRIQAAAIDGRARNIFYRQQQLECLCRTLLENAEDIRKAIIRDYGDTESEATVEFNLTLSAVRNNYAALQPKKAREDEYAVANSKDTPENREPAGIVYIEPTTHTLFYSTVVPLSAALAAGNCVIILMGNSLRAIPSLLRRLLPTALSYDTFAIASSPIKDEEFLGKAIIVDQNGSDVRWPKMNQLISLPNSPVVAVVDRTANVQNAAKEVVSARFAFGATSPYAPDVVLVNEFAKKGFLQAVLSECVNLSSGIELDGKIGRSHTSSRVGERLKLLQQTHKDVRVVVQESSFAVADLPTRLEELPKAKNTDPVLVVCSTRSLDDAIDLLVQSSSAPYLAAYHFSNLASAKYLSQFVDARASFINHIPRELLVGPTFPVERPFKLAERYAISLFEVPRPILVNSSIESAVLSVALDSPNNTSAQQLWKAAGAPLAVMNRSKGGAIGFFEQGFLVNAGLILASTVAISSTGAWYLWRYARRG